MSETPTRLDIDPGAPRRKANSGCVCLVWIALLLGTLFTSWDLYSIVSSYVIDFSNNRYPYRALYHNSALPESRSDSVVRPLIDAQQTFDIAVSVWVRATNKEEEEYKRTEIIQEVDSGMEGRERKGKEENMPKKPAMDEDYHEKPLYSDIAFRGLRLSDKGISTAINFRLPTVRFLDTKLTPNDLRASFVLIPSSPSLIDYLKNYSSWKHNSSLLRPHRAWPFPLDSLEQRNRTLADEAIESFGVSIPLLQFQSIQHPCSNPTGEKDRNGEDGKVGAAKTKVGDHDDDSDNEGRKSITPLQKFHPHVITRTQLYIVDETNLFNRVTYNKYHKLLKTSGSNCNTNSFCWRPYTNNGHWETRLQLEIPKPGSDAETEIQWAYAPYLDTLMHAAGVRDLIPVPVSNENCSTSTDGSEVSSEVAAILPNAKGAEFMNITWRISFSGRSPGKLAFAERFSRPYHATYNASEWEKTAMHNAAELNNGLFGHRFHDDAHPRRRLLVIILSFICRGLSQILGIHYWYTRVSTVSISISGTACLALSPILKALVWIVSAATDESHALNKLPFFLLLHLFTDILVPFMMIKAVTRSEFAWWNGTTWSPTVWRVKATHKERVSMRLDARMNWRTKGGIFLFLVGIYYFFTPHKHAVIPSLIPTPTLHDVPETKVHDLDEIIIPLAFTGSIIQLLLNHRSRTFAGSYKSSVVVDLMLQAMDLAQFVPAVLGRFDARPALYAHEVMISVLLVPIAWQALTRPSVPQSGGDEVEE